MKKGTNFFELGDELLESLRTKPKKAKAPATGKKFYRKQVLFVKRHARPF